MTATPHNGKEDDFQLFMALLDGDRFEGKFRDGVHVADASDLMRRLVKEKLLKFDGTPLFPERIAYTVNYTLSDAEADLYKKSPSTSARSSTGPTALEKDGRKGHRRLRPDDPCSAGWRRRPRRSTSRSAPARAAGEATARGAAPQTRRRSWPGHRRARPPDRRPEEDIDDLDDAPEAEVEEAEEKVVDQATAARTIAELEAEIATLRRLEDLALQVRRAGTRTANGTSSPTAPEQPGDVRRTRHRRKLIIFTEHRDTLNYLAERIRRLLGQPEAVVDDPRRDGPRGAPKARKPFTQDKEVQILVATDAAGEGINLQRAHLMVNYDLPWNPNRLEQRFGRIHRIGQTEVCHLWNLVAEETREGEVFIRLLEKLEEEREALGGQVFDVLGQVTFDDRPLRDC